MLQVHLKFEVRIKIDVLTIVISKFNICLIMSICLNYDLINLTLKVHDLMRRTD